MTDFDYDVMLRKRLASQAKYRKRGSKSKKCPLQSDGMTRRQWERRNGEVVSMDLNRPMDWKTFKGFPVTMQETYLKQLQDRYQASGVDLAEMFGVHPVTVRKYIQDQNFDIKFKKGGGNNVAHMIQWNAFVNGSYDRPQEDVPLDIFADSDPPEAVQPEVIQPETRKPAMSMSGFSLEFKGDLNVDEIANSLLHILGDNTSGNIKIICDLV